MTLRLKVSKEKRRRNAPLLIIRLLLCSLDAAANKINFRTRKTMMVAQQLYEGINIDFWHFQVLLLICVRIQLVLVLLHKSKALIVPIVWSPSIQAGSKIKNASGAQDALTIRPSNVFNTPESIFEILG